MDSVPQSSGVYQIVCCETGKIYIGSALRLATRFRKHLTRLRSNQHENAYLQHAWNKHGEAAFQFIVLELTPPDQRLACEQRWLDTTLAYQREHGYNISLKAGAPMTGRKHTPEALEKISRANAGRKHTEETRRMMSERNKGTVFAPPVTEETRQKLRAAMQDRAPVRHTHEDRCRMRVKALLRFGKVQLPGFEDL